MWKRGRVRKSVLKFIGVIATHFVLAIPLSASAAPPREPGKAHLGIHAEADTRSSISWEGEVDYLAFPRLERIHSGRSLFLEYGFELGVRSDSKGYQGVREPTTYGGGTLGGNWVLHSVPLKDCRAFVGGTGRVRSESDILGQGQELEVDLSAHPGLFCDQNGVKTLAFAEFQYLLSELEPTRWALGGRVISRRSNGLQIEANVGVDETGLTRSVGEIALPLSLFGEGPAVENYYLTVGLEGQVQFGNSRRGSTDGPEQLGSAKESVGKAVFGFRIAH